METQIPLLCHRCHLAEPCLLFIGGLVGDLCGVSSCWPGSGAQLEECWSSLLGVHTGMTLLSLECECNLWRSCHVVP